MSDAMAADATDDLEAHARVLPVRFTCADRLYLMPSRCRADAREPTYSYQPGSGSERIYRQWYREGYHAPKDDLHQKIDWKAAADFNRFYYALVERVTGEDAAPAWQAGSTLRR